MVTDEMVEKAARCIEPDAFAILDGGDQWRIINSHHKREATRTKARAALEAALSAAEPVEQDENPMRFFADNVDRWGALEWFNRMVDACEDHDRKLTQAFHCEDVDEKDMLSLSADTSRMIMSSSAFQLARNHKDDIRSALSAQVQDESEIVDCLLAGKPFVFDPATNFCHTDDGGAPEHGIKYVPAAQVQDVAGTEAIAALKEAEPYVEICHSLMTQKETSANVWRVLKQVRTAIAAAPAKQEG